MQSFVSFGFLLDLVCHPTGLHTAAVAFATEEVLIDVPEKCVSRKALLKLPDTLCTCRPALGPIFGRSLMATVSDVSLVCNFWFSLSAAP